MQFEREIERAVRHQAASDIQTAKTQAELVLIIDNVMHALEKSQYDFSNCDSTILKQGGKKRFVKLYRDIYSAESVLCQCVKQILDRTFKVRYPNRNKTIKSLFGTLLAIKQMSDFTIVKFDFKDYFNSVSAIYVFEKFLKLELLDRFEADLVAEFVYKTKYTYAGFNTSNAIAEIAAKYFDDAVRQAFASKGILYFERYIDDSVLILNEHVEEIEIKSILQEVLLSVFHDDTTNAEVKCKTRFNNNKFQYLTRRSISTTPVSVDYLGYEFWFELYRNKVDIKYGITQAKRDKYNKRIYKLILCYTDSHHKDFGDLELLRHRIMAFTSREVYVNKHFRSNIWKVKGFISNYGELRYLLETGFIQHDTQMFLKNMVDDAFVKANVPEPYFLKGAKLKSGYNLFENMKVNKTILLVDHIGYDYKSLVKLCRQVNINNFDINGKRRGYGTLVRDYLIKVKVGY
ncbi:MAG: hypothetical protein QM657_07360 [Lacrimispora sp.]|uniref:reverse transcriptase domain-containing protein n=1 Tax=Lacrimispora sp. TaxID=2719234 RepID=UPI0039E26287